MIKFISTFFNLNNSPFHPLQFLLIVLVCYFPTDKCLSQDSTKFRSTVQKLIELKPKSYLTINGELRSFRYDSLLMTEFLERSNSINYLDGSSYALNQLGAIYRNKSDYRRSINYHLQGLERAQEAQNVDMEILSLNMIGVAYRRIDAIKSALDYNQKALEIADTIKNPSIHIVRNINIALNSIGNLYQSLEQYDLAIEKFEEALERERELNNIRGLAINNQNIGDCLEHKGELDEALKYYRKSLAYNEEAHLEYGEVICKNSIAQVYLKKKQPKNALKLLGSLVEPTLRIGDNFISSSVFVNLGWTHTQLGNYNNAEHYFNEGLTMAVGSNIPNMVEASYRHLAELEEKKGNFKVAKEYLQKSYQIEKEITSERNFRYINDVIMRYQTEKKNNQIEILENKSQIAELKLRKNKTSLLVGLLILILTSTILFILYRQYQTKNEKKVLSLEQNMLRSQMNPHFLFNSLNSIKLYIINNDKKNAVHYLNKFSKLVRKILEGSSNKEITLDEELETAELYLNIENIRFSNEIDYEITVDEDIQPENIKIPSLVLQPFLENAIWHGLSSKQDDKNLWIRISRVDDFHIQITISDNGVGRYAAEKAKENRILKRKSVGIDITRERLANFAKDYQNEFDVTILDLFEEDGQPKGTEVVLKIPTI